MYSHFIFKGNSSCVSLDYTYHKSNLYISSLKIFIFLIITTFVITSCTTKPVPRPSENWIYVDNPTSEGRVDVTDIKYTTLSSKSVKISGRIWCQQKYNSYMKEVNSGKSRNYNIEWRTSAVNQILIKSILGPYTASIDNQGRFEFILIIPEHDNMFFNSTNILESGNSSSRDLLTVDITPIQISRRVDYPTINFARIPIFFSENITYEKRIFDINEAVRDVEKMICSKVILKFEDMRSRLPENPLVTIIGISGPTKSDLIKKCINLGYNKTQAVNIVAKLNYLEPNRKISDSGQMVVFNGIKKGIYGIEARNAGAHFTRLDLIIDDDIIERTILLSPDKGQMIFKDSNFKGGVLVR